MTILENNIFDYCRLNLPLWHPKLSYEISTDTINKYIKIKLCIGDFSDSFVIDKNFEETDGFEQQIISAIKSRANNLIKNYEKNELLRWRRLTDSLMKGGGNAMLREFGIKKVIFSNPATIVYWVDGSKTVVQCKNEPYDPEKGLAMAISKKALGNKGNYFNEFKKWLPKDGD